jgi:hypothetical protein
VEAHHRQVLADLGSMMISGSHAPPLPVSNPAGRTTGRKDAALEVESAPAPSPADTPAAPEAEAPAETKPHGLLRAAEHSHRSDVAALRQWINHPELRDSLTVPDLAGEHNGKGFERAVAAYHAVMPATPPPPADPPPVVTDPAPVPSDPVVVPDPVVPDPVVPDPVVVTDPVPTDPVAGDPVVLPDPVVPDGVVDESTVLDLLPPAEDETIQ